MVFNMMNMNRKMAVTLVALLLCSPVGAQEPESAGAPIHRVTRQQTVLNAKNMVVRTRQATYYYLVSYDACPCIELGDGTMSIGNDQFARADVKSIRFKALPHLLLDEDSVTYNRAETLDNGAVALRRTLNLGKWNSIVLPFNLTGNQLRYVFGDDAELASPRAIVDDSQVTLEFSTLDLNTDDVVLRANYHYLLRPTREADVAPGRSLLNFVEEKVYGPVYLIPGVSKKVNQSPSLQSVKNEDGSRQVRFHGTYLKLDGTLLSGSIVKNKKVIPGMYYLNDDALMEQAEDSVAMLGFRSWIQDISKEPVPMRFYIDGIGEDLTAATDAIHSIPAALGLSGKEADDNIYTLSGQNLGAATLQRKAQLAKGIYIINGKKVAIK